LASSIREVEKISDELDRPCLIPVVSTIEGCTDPAKLYLSLRAAHKASYLLESAEGPGEAARYSIIGCDPLLYVRVHGRECDIKGRRDLVGLARKNVETVRGDALEVLKEAMFLKSMSVPAIDPRYMLGAVGYIGYDFVRSLVDIGSHTIDDLRQPEIEFMLPERMIIFDHLARKTYYCSLMLLTEGFDDREAYERALSSLKAIKKVKKVVPPGKRRVRMTTSSNVKRSEFERQVERAKHYIRAGDVIQVVLSRRIELKPAPPLGQFYLNLRRINPSPYMFFLDFPDRSVVGSSPEILVKVKGRKVVTRPIAGTRRRGRSNADDAVMERELRGDEKERAEHVMLVDLGRNDIGQVSEFGSVEVTEFMKVEKYSHVQHLVTNVVGQMRKDVDAFDALRATFPAGTVTGAPKVRAMEIIDEFEPTRRGIYAGAVGSFSYTGDADLAITIRTLVAEKGKGYVQVGAGIVADSIPWKEHYETENKARALFRAAGVL
jgi:anthranilate synthase component 1